MRLDTLILMMTLAAVVVGFIQARAMSIRWQSQLSRIETATGLPRVKDVTKLELVIEEDFTKVHDHRFLTKPAT